MDDPGRPGQRMTTLRRTLNIGSRFKAQSASDDSKHKKSHHISDPDDTLPIDRKIAIVGIGCRYANGIEGVRKFWDMLAKGMDCTVPPPAERFDSSFFLYPGKKIPGKMFNRTAGFLLQNPEAFDRQFFKMSPEEANHLDPQVRLLLEVTWEALADAGIPTHTVRGTNTGVYVGLTASEYGILLGMPNENINQYTNSGINSCMSANRISYEFDFRGPSFVVDTACSSSMYSVHLACEGIRSGSCDMAVAGGVNISLLPVTSIGFCQAGMLAPDGKCKSFDSSADGYSRGEGAGIVVLKSLQRALDDGDRIYAVIRGGALCNDGHTPGIANPSFDSQVSLIENAFKLSHTKKEEVVFVEAHGTGTQVGDKTEANAIGEALGFSRTAEHPPLFIGSVKSNIGHSEGAAGVAGLIKTALTLHYEQIPKVVHFRQGNENVDFESLNLRVPSELTRWPKNSKKLASCSSFGFGGANAHLVLESCSMQRSDRALGGSSLHMESESVVPMILFISAGCKDALKQRLEDWLSYLNENIGNDLRMFNNAVYTAAVRSTHHQYRMGVIARTAREAAEQIRLKLEHDPRVAYNVIEGKTPDGNATHRLVFVFSGMGTQWWGMARQLMEDEPQFRHVIKKIDKILTKCGCKWSLIHMLTRELDRERVNQTEIAQPCVCAVQIALSELYRLRGVTPDAIIGHSVGEVAAAHAAGLVSLEDAVKLIYIRGRQMKKTSGRGSMVAVLHAVEEIQSRLENSEYVSVIDVAAVNSPSQIVLSGDKDSVTGFSDGLKRDGIRCISLRVDNAFHSYQQDDVKKDFVKKLKFLDSTSTKDLYGMVPIVPMMSTVTNEYLDREMTNKSDYWWKNIRQSVKFRTAVEKLIGDGYNCFLEISPHPALSPALRDIIISYGNKTNPHMFVSGSLRRPSDTREVADDKVNILRALAKLHVEGYKFDLDLLFKEGGDYKVMSFPTYPWQRVMCSATTEKANKVFRFPATGHPLLGKPQESSHFKGDSAPTVWRSKLGMSSVPWLRDHKLHGSIIVPAAAHVETMLAAAKNQFPEDEYIILRDAKFEKFIFTPDMKGILETTLEVRHREAQFTLRSFNPTDQTWTSHSRTHIDTPNRARSASVHQMGDDDFHCVRLPTDDIRRKCPFEIDQQEFYGRLWRGGFHLGEMFRCVNTAFFSHDYKEALLYASVPEALEKEFKRYIYHPALLDCSFQGIGICQMFEEQEKARNAKSVFRTWFQVPHNVQKVRVQGKAPNQVVYHIKITTEDGVTHGDIVAADATNQRVFAQLDRITFENVHSNEPEETVQLWRREWEKFPLKVDENIVNQPPKLPPKKNSRLSRPLSAIGSENPGAVIVIKDRQGIAMDLKRRLEVDSVVSVLDPRILIDGDERFRRVLRSLGTVTDIIMLSTLDVKQFGNLDKINKDNFDEIQSMIALSPISLFRAVVTHDAKLRPRVWMVTQGAHAVLDVDVVDPLMAPASALNLTLMHEECEFSIATIDLPSSAGREESAEWLYQYMRSAPTDENLVALRRKIQMPTMDYSQRSEMVTFDAFALRVTMQPQSSFSAPTLSTSWQVDVVDTLKQKRLVVKQNHEVPCDRSQEDVAVNVSAFAVQQLKEPSEKKARMSYLYAGKVTNCSEEIQVLFRMRSDVLGFRSGGNVTQTIWSNANELVPIPANLTAVEAINIVRDYLPAFVAFHDTLKLNENGTVIVCLSSLSDRVGLATTHLALEQGASVFLHVETNDSNYLPVEKLLGILGDSRVVITSNENFNSLINDGSVDVLLFAGEMTQDSNSLQRLVGKLRPFGTIVQIHGRNGASESRINCLPPNTYFLSIDMGLGRFEEMKPRLQDSMIRLLQMFSVHNGFQALKNITVPTAPISKLARSPHASLEEVTVIIDEESIPTTLNFDDIEFSANGNVAYLVTGGSRGFGLTVVEWLVKCGARHIYIISRSTPEEEAVLKFKSFRDTGARITHLKVDMSRDYEVEKALTAIQDNDDLPLEGIFHCATVYNDVMLRNVTPESWNGVMAPKAYGALVLHQLALKMGFPLRYFVMVSSVVEMLGNAGQGSYCAANTFLSGLCNLRRKLGLPATVISPGVINTSGFAAREGFDKHWENMGMSSLPPSEVLKGLGCILETNLPDLGLTGAMNRRQYAKSNASMLSHHFSETAGAFSALKKLFPNRDCILDSDNDLQMRIRLLPATEAQGIIFKALSDHLVQRLGLSGDVSEDASPMTLGLDSHMSTELSQVIQENFSVTISPMELLNDTLTLRNLTLSIYNKVLSSTGDDEEAIPIPTITRNELWFRIDESIENPTKQLVCFPSVGSGPSLFSLWRQQLADHSIQLISVQCPGWEGREQEKPLQNVQDIVARLAEALVPRLVKGRFVFFGHSLGSLIAFELAHYLWKNHDLCPAHLCASAWYPPTQPYPHPEELEVSAATMRKMHRWVSTRGDPLRHPEPVPVKFSFLDQVILNNTRLMTRLLPSVEAAIHTCKKYRLRHRDQLPCNITAIAGKSDPFVNPALVDDWSKQVHPDFKFKKVVIPGKHMYILSAGKNLLKEISAALASLPVMDNTNVVVNAGAHAMAGAGPLDARLPPAGGATGPTSVSASASNPIQVEADIETNRTPTPKPVPKPKPRPRPSLSGLELT